ncbi:TPA: hypothetical protein U5Z12_001439, partial [Streptococcus agalactiae]|nr:hypothetical protein [Streptococcus agalactiae]
QSLDKYEKSGIYNLDQGVYNYIYQEISSAKHKFSDGVDKIYRLDSTLFPFSVWYDKHLDNNDNYKDNKDFKEYIALLNEITRKARLGYQIVNNHKDGEHKDEAEILDILIRDITFVSKDAPGYKYIPNKRIAAKIIEDLDGVINDFFKNTGKDKPSLEKLKDTEFHKKYLNSTEPYSIETNLPSNYKELKEKQIKKLEYGYKKSSKIYTSAHYALYSEEIDAAKELLQKVKIAKDNYNEIKSMNLSPSIFNQYLQLLQIVISSEINLKKALDNTVDLPIENNFNTLDIQYNKLDTAIKSLRKFVTKYKQEVRKATKSYSKKELVNAELTKVISNDNILLDMQAISSNYGSTKKFVYSVKRLPYVPQVIMTTTSNVLMPQKQVEKVKLLTPFTISNKEVLNHDSLVENDAQKQKVEQEKTKSLAPQKGAVKEQTEQKVSGNTQEIEKKSETVATPQQSSVAQTSVQQPAPVQSVVQESKASQEEINAAHDAISAYKSTVNIANTAGVTTAEMTTLINTQTSNLSDVEKALGNNKVNNGAVNVLREDTARLENMIWNRAYQAIEEFNVARNTYNNQIKTETVPVDNDIEAILAGSQAKISHLDNRIGARRMDQAFVASLLEVTEMSKSISSRIKE